MEAITQHDITLMSALLLDGMDASIIAEKFETIESEVIQSIYPTNHYIEPGLYLRRKEKGTIRLGEDCLEKRCSRCGGFFPINPEFWHNCRNNPDGLLGWCRACELERATGRRNNLKK